jgi:hypothetical protein
MIDLKAPTGCRMPLRSSRVHAALLRCSSWTSPKHANAAGAILCQKAAEARRAAEGVTTRAIKARLESLARDFDRLADAADSAAQTEDALAGVTRQQKRERR